MRPAQPHHTAASALLPSRFGPLTDTLTGFFTPSRPTNTSMAQGSRATHMLMCGPMLESYFWKTVSLGSFLFSSWVREMLPRLHRAGCRAGARRGKGAGSTPHAVQLWRNMGDADPRMPALGALCTQEQVQPRRTTLFLVIQCTCCAHSSKAPNT